MTRALQRRCAILGATVLTAVVPLAPATAQEFVDGLAQPVFAGQPVISHNAWVEVPNLDTDRDGVNDRIRIQVRRPSATDSGVRLPVVMIASPYSGGTRPYHTYDITGPLYEPSTAQFAVVVVGLAQLPVPLRVL